MYAVYEYHSEDFEQNPDLLEKLTAYSLRAFQERDKDAAKNMDVEGWETKSWTLLHAVLSERRFRRGEGRLFFLESTAGEWVASSGVYRSDFDPGVFIGGVRAWTMPGFRSRYLHGEHIFPRQFDWAKQNGGRVFLLTFNDYNKPLAEIFVRGGRERRATGFGVRCADFYCDVELHPRRVRIQKTAQWILKKPILLGYQQDFSGLELSEA